MLTGEIGGSHKEEVFCILCWLMVASHTECFGESTLCIGVLFHLGGGRVKISLQGQRQNYDFGQF